MKKNQIIPTIDRRTMLAMLGGVGARTLFGASSLSCVPSTPQVTEGPYWVDEKLFRSDIRTDPSTGAVHAGTPLALTVALQNLSNPTCVPLVGAYVDIWQCDAKGIYSDERSYNPGGGTGTVTTTGQKFLRGYQITDDNGQVQFTTIYPGWYSGRTIHIHMRVRTYSGSTQLSEFVTQLFFDDSISNTVLAGSDYSRTSARDTTNNTDNVYGTATNPSRMLLTLTQNASGYAGTITAGVAMQSASLTAPTINTGGVTNSASGAAGVAPGSWVTLYGSNLAATSRILAANDLVSNALPTTLGGVSVQINGKAAYVDYISPTHLDVLTPLDSSAGTCAVTVTNAAGTSAAANATMQSVMPGIFTSANYVQAVRASDSVIINGTGAAVTGYVTSASAKPGDTIEIYGTGFGTTSPAASDGIVFTGAYPTSNAVTATIGGIPATVLWAGLVGAGLYQINLTVPEGLTDGDYPVIAMVAGLSSQSGALLKVASA